MGCQQAQKQQTDKYLPWTLTMDAPAQSLVLLSIFHVWAAKKKKKGCKVAAGGGVTRDSLLGACEETFNPERS